MVLTVSSIIICICVLFWSFFFNKKEKDDRELSSTFYWIITMVAFTIFAILLFFKVNEIPVPYHSDEAGAVYDALNIANFHCDRFLYRFPVYFSTGLNALYTYLAAIMIKLFGYSVVTARLPAIILSLISAVFFVRFLYHEHGKRASAIGIICFCFQPFMIMHSRWGLESYLLFPMSLISFLIFYHAIKTELSRWYFLSGIMFGITLYSYAVSYLFEIFSLSIVIIYLFYIRKISLKNLMMMGIPLLCLAFPLLLMIVVNHGWIDEIRTRFFSIPKLIWYREDEIGLRNIPEHLLFDKKNIFYNIFVYDGLIYNVIPKFGTLFYFTIPLILYGFILGIKKIIFGLQNKRISFDFIAMSIFFSMFFELLFIGPYINVNKASAIYFPMLYFMTMGTNAVLRKNKNSAYVLMGLSAVFSVLFVNYYFTEYPKTLERNWNMGPLDDFGKALDFADSINENKETIYLLGVGQPYLYVLLSKGVDAYTFNERKTVTFDNKIKKYEHYRFMLDAVLPECIYIFRPNDSMKSITDDFDESIFNQAQFGTVTVYYPKK